MHVLINAIPIRPGGGLTVLQGIIQGLRQNNSGPTKLSVITSATDTTRLLREQGVADEVTQIMADRGVVARQCWQNFRLGLYAKSIDADVLLTVNFLVPRVSCPQVVYHLDLARYVPIPDDVGMVERTFELLRNRAARQALRKANANIFESQFLRDAAAEFVPDNNPLNDVIYIGLPDAVIDRGFEQHGDKLPSSKIAAVTNPLPHKDNPTMLRAFASLVNQRPDVPWTLEIAGGLDASAWQAHRELADQLGISDRIVWHGYMNHTQLHELLCESLCLLSTSVLESFCMVAVESMARGCPPLVCDTASMPESVGDAGILIETGNHEGFATAMLDLFEDASSRFRLVERGIQHIEALRWSTCGQKFADLFANLKNRPH